MLNNHQDSGLIRKYSVWVLLIVAFGVFVRLMFLDYMAFHHDESIHAYYSWQVFKGNLQSYKYDPTYHGPFLYHFTGLFLLLFGDTDFVARLPFAFMGILVIYFVWRMKPWLGPAGTLASLLLVAISPTLTYFSRFARNDIFNATFSAAILFCGLEYLRSKRNSYLVGMVLALALLYADKENSYMTGFCFGSFIVFYGIYYIFSFPPEARKRAMYEIFVERGPFVKVLALYAVFSCTAFTLVRFVVKRMDYSVLTPPYSMPALDGAWDRYIAANGWVIPLWVTMAIAATAAVFFAITVIQRMVKQEDDTTPFFTRLARRNVIVLVCCLVAFTVYSVLFTTLGTNPNGMKTGVIDYLLYWMGQQDAPRIPGPPDYFALRLVIYEIIPVIAGLAAFVVYSFVGLGLTYFLAFIVAFFGFSLVYWKVFLVKTWGLFNGSLFGLIFVIIALAILFSHRVVKSFSFVPEEKDDYKDLEEKTTPLAPDGLRVFLIYWTVSALFIYALLNEKVPWLIVTQSFPLALLAGVFIGDYWERFKGRGLTYALAVIMGFLVVYEGMTTIQLNFFRPDDPRELMVYTQTGHSIKYILQEIEDAQNKLGPEYRKDYVPENQRKPLVAYMGDATWPYVWYLRNYSTHPPIDESFRNPPPAGTPFLLVDPGLADRVKVWSKGQHTQRTVKHRLWWPPMGDAGLLSFQHELPFHYFAKRNQPMERAWKSLLRYLLYREVWDPSDSGLQPPFSPTVLFVKTPLIEPVPAPKVLPGYMEAPRPLEVIQSVGQQGAAEQQFNQPRGVALSPDDSLLYVLDALNGRVQVFNSDLVYQGYFGGPGTEIGQFATNLPQTNGPNGGIAVGPDGTIFVTDTWAPPSGRINRYNPNGTPLPPLVRPAPDNFFYPRGLAVAPDGTLFVADTGHKEIVKFGPDGTYQGDAISDAFNEPVGVTIANNQIYVCDVGNQRVASFTLQGQPVKTWSVFGWNPQNEGGIPWIEPYVAVDAQGFVYVTDSINNMIHCFDPQGSRVFLGGGEGSAPGLLRGPKGIAVNSQGILYIADSQNHRVVKAKFPK